MNVRETGTANKTCGDILWCRIRICFLENLRRVGPEASKYHLQTRFSRRHIYLWIILTVIVSYPRLYISVACDRCFVWVGYNVDERNSVETDHLFEVDIAVIIPMNVLRRNSEICPIGIGLEDIAPGGTWWFLDCDVEEHRFCTGFQDCVGLAIVSVHGLQRNLTQALHVDLSGQQAETCPAQN